MANKYQRRAANDFAAWNLLRLNLHQALIRGSEIQRLFSDLNQKYEGDFIFDKKYIAESVTKIVDSLEGLIFNLNAMNGVQDIGLYFTLDEIRERMIRTLNRVAVVETTANAGEVRPGYDDELSILLGQILRMTAEFTKRKPDINLTEQSGNITVSELLEICNHKILNIFDSIFMTERAPKAGEISRVSVIRLPVYYIDSGKQEGAPDHRASARKPRENESGETLIDGINEVAGSNKYFNPREVSGPGEYYFGFLLHSVDTLTFFLRGSNYKYLIAANNYDYTGGNYINFISLPISPEKCLMFRNLMMMKLLKWLDFRAFAAGDMIIAAVRNLTRVEMNSHLNMLGKLMVFASAPKILMETESDMQTNIENFLENIV
jgi:hypothetical protein